MGTWTLGCVIKASPFLDPTGFTMGCMTKGHLQAAGQRGILMEDMQPVKTCQQAGEKTLPTAATSVVCAEQACDRWQASSGVWYGT